MADFDGLRAIFFNGTLKKSPETSNTDGLVQASVELMKKNGVEAEVIHTPGHTPGHCSIVIESQGG